MRYDRQAESRTSCFVRCAIPPLHHYLCSLRISSQTASMSEGTDVSDQGTMDEVYNDTSADLRLISSEGTIFCVHSFYLKAHGSVGCQRSSVSDLSKDM